MNNLYDVLEVCLKEVEKGTDIEVVLARYPDLAAELRPILETSAMATTVSFPGPSAEMVRRNRAKVLQHAAQLRESNVHTTRRLWSVPLRRALVTLVVIAALFISSTGLVSAASTTLPGDNLYPVKRTWEDVLVLFTFNLQAREALEVEHENERLHELQELFTEGRSAEVDFSGQVTRQEGDLWLVSGIPVVISHQTGYSAQPVRVGDAVHVIGVTQSDGAVLAQWVDLLPAGVPLPEVDDDDSSEDGPDHSDNSNDSDNSNGSDVDNSGEGSGERTPEPDESETSEPESESGSNGNDNDSNSGTDDSNENGSNVNDSVDNRDDNSNDNSGSDDNGGDNDSVEDNSGSGGGGEDDD